MKVSFYNGWTKLLLLIDPGPLPLKEIREWLGWSQSKLANEAGVSAATVSRIEKDDDDDKRCIRNATAVKLANALGCKVKDIAWPRDLTDRGRYPGEESTKRSPVWQKPYCLKCFTSHSLSSDEDDDECETYS